MAEETTDIATPDVQDTDVQSWIDKINAEAQSAAEDLSNILNCEVTPFVFVVEELKDVAVGFIRKPDAKQMFKLFRNMGSASYEDGLILAARTQLVREAAGKQVSDARFMDADGNYDKQYSVLNFNLMKEMSACITIYQNAFKKK